ncbi:hypothetical protein Tco_1173619 [Tanacetum coccineum]
MVTNLFSEIASAGNATYPQEFEFSLALPGCLWDGANRHNHEIRFSCLQSESIQDLFGKVQPIVAILRLELLMVDRLLASCLERQQLTFAFPGWLFYYGKHHALGLPYK